MPAKAASTHEYGAPPTIAPKSTGCAASSATKSTLEFEAGETFVGLGAGDIEGLAFVGQDNHLFLKPKAARVATNLTVLTTRRRLSHSTIRVIARSGRTNTTSSIRCDSPMQQRRRIRGRAAAKRLDSQLDDASSKRPHNIDYWYCGEPTLRPTGASDDGVHTRLTFAANADLPAIFVRNDDGSESLLNFSLDAGDVIIHRVAQRFILRRGKLTGCVVNQGFAGGGKRLESRHGGAGCRAASSRQRAMTARTGDTSVRGERGSATLPRRLRCSRASATFLRSA